MSKLYATASYCEGIINMAVSSNHDTATATAVIECTSGPSFTDSLGDLISINLGYTDPPDLVFKGYIKQIERKIPSNTYVVTAYDKLIKAQDYFIASTNPLYPLQYERVDAEDLVEDLMNRAGLPDFTYTTTGFRFGNYKPFDVNLVSVYDYCKAIANLLTWSLWADQDGVVHFENRKPYVMDGLTGQPGDSGDVSTGQVIDSSSILSINWTLTERYVRNRVVVYGGGDLSAEAKEGSPVLPTGFYKTAVLAFPELVDDRDMANNIASYNLDLLHRVMESMSVTIVGDPTIFSRTVITLDYPDFYDKSGDWYVFGCDHSLSDQGFVTNLELRRMTRLTPVDWS